MDGTSHLRDLNSANEALRHLTAMRDLLMDEQAADMDIQVKNMEELIERIKYLKRDIVKDPHSRRKVEKIGRMVMTKFMYRRMKNYIKMETQ